MNNYSYWKYLKKHIKNLLDMPQISIEEKILQITGLLEDYYWRYLK